MSSIEQQNQCVAFMWDQHESYMSSTIAKEQRKRKNFTADFDELVLMAIVKFNTLLDKQLTKKNAKSIRRTPVRRTPVRKTARK